ncbi:Molybdenum cofactor biosynthesis protein B [Nymphon striatum]|nr:Molybdenum cofactor biosynthesis protein B [Nymphon striatum]
MTTLQYNALKVLYVEDTEGRRVAEQGDWPGVYIPEFHDVTRLLERMVDKGWITRERDLVNKRVVRSQLTDIGVQLVESAYLPLKEAESKQLNHLTESEKTMPKIDTSVDFIPLNIAVMVVSDSRDESDDKSGKMLVKLLTEDDHNLAEKLIVKDDIYEIRAAVSKWIADPEIHAVITTGGTGLTGRDVTPEGDESFIR